MLTVPQALALTTGQSKPPWRLGVWREIFSVDEKTPISTKDVIAELEKQHFLLFAETRDSSVLLAGDIDALTATWNVAPGPGRLQLDALSDMLSPFGMWISFVSRDRRVVGIAGTIGLTVGFQTLRITGDNANAIRDSANAAIALGGAGVALGPLPVKIAGAYLICFGVGEYIGLALDEFGLNPLSEVLSEEVSSGQASYSAQTTGDGDLSVPNLGVYGIVPPGLDPDAIYYADPVDLNEVPWDPVEEPGTPPPEEPDY